MISLKESLSLKGFAILLVVFGHLIANGKIDLPASFKFISAFGVSIFLMLSGYGVKESFDKNGLDNFFSKKLVSVLYPYIIATAIGITLRTPIHDFFKTFYNDITFKGFVISHDLTMWFIPFIIIWYLIFFIVFSVTTSTKARVILLILSSTAMVSQPWMHGYDFFFRMKLYAFCFPAGVLLSIASKGQGANRFIKSICTASTAFFLFSFAILLNSYSLFFYSLSSFLFGLACIRFAKVLDFHVFTWIGVHSYEIYLFEGIFLWLSLNKDNTNWVISYFFIIISVAYSFKRLHEQSLALACKFTKTLKNKIR